MTENLGSQIFPLPKPCDYLEIEKQRFLEAETVSFILEMFKSLWKKAHPLDTKPVVTAGPP